MIVAKQIQKNNFLHATRYYFFPYAGPANYLNTLESWMGLPSSSFS